jgi:hypothetical protein
MPIQYQNPYERLQFMIAHPEQWQSQGNHAVTLNFAAPVVFVSGRTQAYRVKITVIRACLVPEEIFVYSLMPDNSLRFENVASPNDLLEYPVGAPDNTDRPYFRLAYADLLFRNADMCVDAAVGVANDVLELTRTLDGLDELVELGDMLIGNCESSSSSSSSSA